MIRDFSSPPAPRRSRLGLFAPFAVFGLLVAVYGAYWVWMSGQIRQAAESWVAQREGEGYAIAYDRLSVGGFPFRFTVNVGNPDIAAPAGDGGWRMAMPQVSASALPYNLTHWIVAFGSPAEIDLAGEDGTRALLATAGTSRISLSSSRAGTVHAGAELESFRLIEREGGTVLVETLDRLVLTSDVEEGDQMRIRLEMRGLELGADQLDEAMAGAFGHRIDLLRFDTVVTEWSALAADANLAVWSASGGEMRIAMAELNWGDARLGGEGTMGVDDALRPEGRLSVLVTEPESLVAALVDGGIVASGDGEALRLALMMAPRRDQGVALPFRFQQGGVFLGPVRLGDTGPLTGQLPSVPDLPELSEEDGDGQ